MLRSHYSLNSSCIGSSPHHSHCIDSSPKRTISIFNTNLTYAFRKKGEKAKIQLQGRSGPQNRLSFLKVVPAKSVTYGRRCFFSFCGGSFALEQAPSLNSSFYFSIIDCEAIRAWIALKLGILLNQFHEQKCNFVKKSASMW